MSKITVAINTPFGEIRVSGEDREAVLNALEGLDQNSLLKSTSKYLVFSLTKQKTTSKALLM